MRNFLLIVIAMILGGCGVNANLSFSAVPGDCAVFTAESGAVAESIPAPYCMQVTITNNGSGQNFINSTTASITNITMNVTGANNILSPATSASTLDPSNCQGSTISPGGQCIFYLQINSESYPVESTETATLTLNYNVNNDLFGGGNQTGSSSMIFYEVTNLYISEASGNIAIFNGDPNNPFTTMYAIKTGGITTTSIDNTAFGYLYLGNSYGAYEYGNESTSPSFGTTNINSAINLINSSSNMYIVTSRSGTFQWALGTNSWVNSTTPVYSAINNTKSNISALGATGVIYLVGGTQVYNCTNTGSSSGNQSCNPEANPITNGDTITAMAFNSSSNQANTGLYVGTNQHLYAESKGATTATNNWVPITDPDGNIIQTQINTMVTDLSNNLYSGDNSGTIWLITGTSTDNHASKLYASSDLNNGIQRMTIDNVANILYFVTNSGQLYSCSLGIAGTTPKCLPTLVPAAQQSVLSNVVGMNIGSELQTSL